MEKHFTVLFIVFVFFGILVISPVFCASFEGSVGICSSFTIRLNDSLPKTGAWVMDSFRIGWRFKHSYTFIELNGVFRNVLTRTEKMWWNGTLIDTRTIGVFLGFGPRITPKDNPNISFSFGLMGGMANYVKANVPEYGNQASVTIDYAILCAFADIHLDGSQGNINGGKPFLDFLVTVAPAFRRTDYYDYYQDHNKPYYHYPEWEGLSSINALVINARIALGMI